MKKLRKKLLKAFLKLLRIALLANIVLFLVFFFDLSLQCRFSLLIFGLLLLQFMSLEQYDRHQDQNHKRNKRHSKPVLPFLSKRNFSGHY